MNNLDLATLSSTQGFKIFGAVDYDCVGESVSKAGDINDDGIDDLIIGAPLADPSNRTRAGTAYIIYGKRGLLTNLDLLNFGTVNGFKISGACPNDLLGDATSYAGDINGDGIDDLVVGAYNAALNNRPYAGAAYVIYGKNSGLSDIDLLTLTTTDGFKISGAAAGDYTGRSVSGAADINGDGIDDLIVGAPDAGPNDRNWAGAAYVIYGKNGGLKDLDLLNFTALDGLRSQGLTLVIGLGLNKLCR